MNANMEMTFVNLFYRRNLLHVRLCPAGGPQGGGSTAPRESVTIPLMEYSTANNGTTTTNGNHPPILLTDGQPPRPAYVRSQSANAAEKVSVKPNDRQFRRSQSTTGTRSRNQSSSEVRSQPLASENQTQSTSVDSAAAGPPPSFPSPPGGRLDENLSKCIEFKSSLSSQEVLNVNKRDRR